MITQDVHDEVLLQQAGKSAARLLHHLLKHAPHNRGGHAPSGIGAAAMPPDELEAAIASLRRLMGMLPKEAGSR